jgi:hypothetical protein
MVILGRLSVFTQKDIPTDMFQRIKHSYPYIGDCVKTEHFAEHDLKEDTVED